METTVLQLAYQRLAESVTQTQFSPLTDSDEWSVELVIAHVIATNRTLSILAVQLLDGREAVFEGGTLSVTPHWLQPIIQTAGDMDSLLATLRQSSGELLALAQRFDNETANKMFPAKIYDGQSKVIWDGPISFQDLVGNVAHLSMHTEQIQTLVGSKSQ